MLLSELILAHMRLTELDFGQFLGSGTENLPNLGVSKRKLGNLRCLFKVEVSTELKNAEKGVLWGS